MHSPPLSANLSTLNSLSNAYLLILYFIYIANVFVIISVSFIRVNQHYKERDHRS